MDSSDRRVIEIVGVYFEADRNQEGKYWVWLKVNSAISCAVEVLISAEAGDENTLSHPTGRPIERLSLGFHSLQEGLTELPPLPFWVKTGKKARLSTRITIRSAKDPLIRHQVVRPILPSPFTVGGAGKTRQLDPQ